MGEGVVAAVHDYTRQYWGHALHDPKIEHDDEHSYLRCLGHGPRVRAGDILLLKMQSGKIARFQIQEIEHYSNPADMFDVKRAVFDGYQEPSNG